MCSKWISNHCPLESQKCLFSRGIFPSTRAYASCIQVLWKTTRCAISVLMAAHQWPSVQSAPEGMLGTQWATHMHGTSDIQKKTFTSWWNSVLWYWMVQVQYLLEFKITAKHLAVPLAGMSKTFNRMLMCRFRCFPTHFLSTLALLSRVTKGFIGSNHVSSW